MEKINLLYVITKLELGGAQKHLLSLVANLDTSRFNPFLFTARSGLLIQQAQAISGLTLKKSRFLEGAINPLKDLFALIEICRFIRANNIGIVHTHSSKAGILGRWAARLSGINPIIHTVHGWSFNAFQPAPLRNFFRYLEKITARFTHKLIVVSEYDREKGLSNRIGNKDQYALIRYGINYEEFTCPRSRIREEFKLSPEALLVGNISCFKPQKSPLDFVKLASLVSRSMPQVKFILVGDGVLRKKIEKLITRLNLNGTVILTGWRKDTPAILSALDIFALTSLWEGLPIAALEAIASSKPVLATDTGGVREAVIEGENGFLVPLQDMKKMSEKLILLLRDAALRTAMGRNSRGYLRSDFCTEKMIAETRALYEKLVKKRR